MVVLVFFPILNSYDSKYIVRAFRGCSYSVASLVAFWWYNYLSFLLFYLVEYFPFSSEMFICFIYLIYNH